MKIKIEYIFAVLFLFATQSASAQTPAMEKAAENETLKLFVDMSVGDFAVVDKRSGFVWWSNPPDAADDPRARGINRMNLRSQLWVDFADRKANSYYRNSYTGSTKKDGVSVRRIDNGVRVTFTFPAEQVVVPVEYTLRPDHLSARIVVSELQQHPDAVIMSIGILPFFGAGGADDVGFLFVPDGSGAILTFDNAEQARTEFDEPVYGRDAAQSLTRKRSIRQELLLPVFGIQNGDNAMLAVITEGDYAAGIRAVPAGLKTSYNQAFAEFHLARSANVELKGIDRSVRNITKVVQPEPTLPYYEVRYYPLVGREAGYVGMAARYRRFLEEERGFGSLVESGRLPLYCELIGGIRHTASVLGIPVPRVVPLTTFAQAGEIARDLTRSGVSPLIVRLTHWMKDIEGARIPRTVDAAARLGGGRGLEALIGLQETLPVSFYLDAGVMSFEKSGNGFSRHTDTARAVSRLPIVEYSYKLSTWERDPEEKPRYLLAPELIPGAALRWARAAASAGYTELSFPRLGSALYSSLEQGGASRVEAGRSTVDTLRALVDSGASLLLSGAHGYALPSASHLVEMPITDSGYKVGSRSVPFVQIVLHGRVSYAGPALNFSADPWLLVLKSLETGSAPYFVWTAADPSVLETTDHEAFFAAHYQAWRDTALFYYAILSEALGPLAREEITDHRRIEEGVVETEFGGTTTITINYNDRPVTRRGVTIPARGYRVFHAAEREER